MKNRYYVRIVEEVYNASDGSEGENELEYLIDAESSNEAGEIAKKEREEYRKITCPETKRRFVIYPVRIFEIPKKDYIYDESGFSSGAG